jgi:general secretion pathway protein F
LLALTYPLLLSVVALAVVSALMVYVVPQVTEVFVQNGQVLPWATRTLIAASDLVRDFGALALLLAALAATATGLALRRPQLRSRWQAACLRLPLLGRLLRAADSSRFARTLALLTGSAVPLLEALQIAAGVVQALPLRDALARVAVRVREGQPLGRALAETRQFPPIAVRLIQSGERSGRLDAMLAEAAAHQERELDTALGVAGAALGPVVIIAVGGLVLFIVLAILLPIFDLNTLVR